MIYNVSRRCDVVGLYWDWFVDKVKGGSVSVKNPKFPWKVAVHDFTQDAEGFHFTTRDLRQAAADRQNLSYVIDSVPNVWEVGFSMYPQEIEPANTKDSLMGRVDVLRVLSEVAGSERISLVYGPVFGTDNIDGVWHAAAFLHLYRLCEKYVSRIRISFGHIMRELHDKKTLLRELSYFELVDFIESLPKDDRIFSGLCDGDFSGYGLASDLCCGFDWFASANGVVAKNIKCKGHSHTAFRCTCIEGRDIGFPNTCDKGCTWCIRTDDAALAHRRLCAQTVSQATLGTPVMPTDTVRPAAKQRVYLKH